MVFMTDSVPAFRSIPIFVVPGLLAVRFYEETRAHIWNSHPELGRIFVGLPSFDKAIETALSGPDRVLQSDRNSLVFISQRSTNATGQPLCIPVKLIGVGRSGYVKTAYFGSIRAARGLVYERVQSDG